MTVIEVTVASDTVSSMVAAAVWVPSVTVTANAKRPASCGVPLSTPSVPSVSPGGGRLKSARVHVSGASPPVAVSIPMYGCPTNARESIEVPVICSSDVTTLRVNCRCP